MKMTQRIRSGAWRSRWAAVGAAVAVTLGAGSMVAVNAASSAPSSFVSVDPARILDTRTDVGLAGPFVSGVAQKLQVTGSVPIQPPGGVAAVAQEVVPPTATSAVFNVTVVRPATQGFLSIRPGDATGTPATSNINWAAGGPTIANAVTVQVPASGQIDIFVSGTVGEVLIDVAGYNVPASAGPAGPQGIAGPVGPPGVPGPVTMFNGFGPTLPSAVQPPQEIEFTPGQVNVVVDGVNLAVVILPLTGPAVLGGTTYKLDSVEYCIENVTGGVNAFVGSAIPNANFVDQTTRLDSGCYDVDASTLPAAKSYSIEFLIDGTAGQGVSFVAVQSTWVEV